MQESTLLERIADIGDSFAQTDHGVALLGIGSVGAATPHADRYSNLDFYVVVENGYKQQYLTDLNWLSRVTPISWQYRHTEESVRLWFNDAVMCAFAVYEKDDIQKLHAASSKVVWQKAGVNAAHYLPKNTSPTPPAHNIEWIVGEALSALNVGLSRYLRGEKLSAFNLIQSQAVELVLELIERSVDAQLGQRDPFAIERRFETRFPDFAPHLNAMMRGYAHTPESAEYIVQFLDARWPVPEVIIQTLLHQIREAKGHSLK